MDWMGKLYAAWKIAQKAAKAISGGTVRTEMPENTPRTPHTGRLALGWLVEYSQKTKCPSAAI